MRHRTTGIVSALSPGRSRWQK